MTINILFAPTAPILVHQVAPRARVFELYVGSDQSRREVRLSLANDDWADPGIKDASPYPQVNLSVAKARNLANRLNTLADMIESGHPIVLVENSTDGLVGEVALPPESLED